MKYTLIDKLAYELYVEASIKNKNIYTGYITPFSNIGFQNFVKDHKENETNNSWYYNNKSINQKIRKEKLKKINDNRR